MAYTPRYITASELSSLMQSNANLRVVDVRDSDFVGGNITGAINFPSNQRTEQSVQDLVKTMKDTKQVIFHCALSQERGPKLARIYATELSKQHSVPPTNPSTAQTPPATTQTSDSAPSEVLPNPYEKSSTENGQEVLILRDGFTGWQSLYRNDPTLTENFDEKVWGSSAQ